MKIASHGMAGGTSIIRYKHFYILLQKYLIMLLLLAAIARIGIAKRMLP